MNWHKFFHRIVSVAADVLWPPACILCKSYCREIVCKECRARSLLYERGSAFCGAHDPVSSCAPACRRLYAAGIYTGKYKEAVIEYKFHGELWIGKGFAGLIYEMLLLEKVFDRCLCVTYVPISDKRFYERGFDQSGFIADIIAQRAGVACKTLLKRNVQGGRQSKFSRRERLENSKDRFEFNDGAYECEDLIDKSRSVILIDDILTTGATMQECASLLKERGFKNIVGVVIATGRKDV